MCSRARPIKPECLCCGSHLGVPTAPPISDRSPAALKLLLPVAMVAVWQAYAVIRGRARHPAVPTIIE